MPPRTCAIPRTAFASHAKQLQTRPRMQCRFASTAEESPVWRGKDPLTKLGKSITGAMEWQTSMYSYNKNLSKTLSVAAMNAEKLLQAYVTMKEFDPKKKDTRAIRSALSARRKAADKLYVSKPRIKDFGDRIEMTAFIYDGKDLMRELDKRFNPRDTPTAGLQPSAADRLTESSHKLGLESLLSRVYNKPTTLTLIRLAKPHLDADILAAVVAQRLRDRTNTPRRVIRDATWRSPLPNAETVTALRAAAAARDAARGHNFGWREMTLGAAAQSTAAGITKGLGLSQVSSIEVQAAGRLTKRLTANRSQRKIARRGASANGPGFMLRGHRKAHLQYAFASGKRRVGQFGIKVMLGHN